MRSTQISRDIKNVAFADHVPEILKFLEECKDKDDLEITSKSNFPYNCYINHINNAGALLRNMRRAHLLLAPKFDIPLASVGINTEFKVNCSAPFDQDIYVMSAVVFVLDLNLHPYLLYG